MYTIALPFLHERVPNTNTCIPFILLFFYEWIQNINTHILFILSFPREWIQFIMDTKYKHTYTIRTPLPPRMDTIYNIANNSTNNSANSSSTSLHTINSIKNLQSHNVINNYIHTHHISGSIKVLNLVNQASISHL